MTWYRPWIIPNDPHYFVAKFISLTGQPQDLNFHGLHSVHDTVEQMYAEIDKLMAEVAQ